MNNVLGCAVEVDGMLVHRMSPHHLQMEVANRMTHQMAHEMVEKYFKEVRVEYDRVRDMNRYSLKLKVFTRDEFDRFVFDLESTVLRKDKVRVEELEEVVRSLKNQLNNIGKKVGEAHNTAHSALNY